MLYELGFPSSSARITFSRIATDTVLKVLQRARRPWTVHCIHHQTVYLVHSGGGGQAAFQYNKPTNVLSKVFEYTSPNPLPIHVHSVDNIMQCADAVTIRTCDAGAQAEKHQDGCCIPAGGSRPHGALNAGVLRPCTCAKPHASTVRADGQLTPRDILSSWIGAGVAMVAAGSRLGRKVNIFMTLVNRCSGVASFMISIGSLGSNVHRSPSWL